MPRRQRGMPVPTAAELQIIIEAQDRASVQLQAVGQQVARLERQVQSAGRGGGILGALGIGSGVAVATPAINLVTNSLRAMGQAVLEGQVALERQTLLFAQFTGSGQRAAEVVRALRAEAARS